MSVQDNLLNEKNNGKSDESIAVAPECNEGCSFWNSEPENEYSFLQNRACRMRDTAPTDRYVKLLDFTHFSRHMVFSKSERKDKKKAILNGVNVSVVLDLVCATPKKYR